MSFIITRTSIPVKRYPELCNATMSAEAETLQVTVTVEYLESLNGQYGTICYSMQPEGGSKGTGMFEFSTQEQGARWKRQRLPCYVVFNPLQKQTQTSIN